MTTNDHSTELKESLLRLERIISRHEKDVRSGCGITFAQSNAIIEIGDEEISLNDLARVMDLDKSTVSRTVDSLVKPGLIERYSDPGDRRYVRIRLTEKGRDVRGKIEAGMSEYYRELYGSIPENKRAPTLDGLKTLIESLQAVRACRRRCDECQ